jgi:hypothetical protein
MYFHILCTGPKKRKTLVTEKTPKTQIVNMHVPSIIHLVSPGSKVCLKNGPDARYKSPGSKVCLKQDGPDAVCGRLLSFFSQLFFVKGLWQQKLFLVLACEHALTLLTHSVKNGATHALFGRRTLK